MVSGNLQRTIVYRTEGTERSARQIDRVNRELRETQVNSALASRGINGVGASLRSATPLMASFGVTMGAVGFTAFAAGAFRSGDEVQKLGVRLGIGADRLSGWRQVLREGDLDLNQFRVGVVTLQRNLADASRGIGEARDVLRELRIDPQSLLSMDSEQQILAVFRALEQIESATERNRAAQRLMGESGAQLATVLGTTYDQITDNITITQEQADAAAAASDEFSRMANEVSALRDVLVLEFAPALGATAGGLGDVVRELREINAAWGELPAPIRAGRGIFDIFARGETAFALGQAAADRLGIGGDDRAAPLSPEEARAAIAAGGGLPGTTPTRATPLDIGRGVPADVTDFFGRAYFGAVTDPSTTPTPSTRTTVSAATGVGAGNEAARAAAAALRAQRGYEDALLEASFITNETSRGQQALTEAGFALGRAIADQDEAAQLAARGDIAVANALIAREEAEREATEAAQAKARADRLAAARARREQFALEAQQDVAAALARERGDLLFEQDQAGRTPQERRIAQYRRQGLAQINALTAFTQGDADFIQTLREQHQENVDLFTRIVRNTEETARNTRERQVPVVIQQGGSILDPRFGSNADFQRLIARAVREAQRDQFVGGRRP